MRIAEPARFLDVFSTRGLERRRAHGSLGAHAFAVAGEPDRAMVLIDWLDREGFESFRSNREVRETMRSGGALESPAFTILERTGAFAA